jgi:hypothetical protein
MATVFPIDPEYNRFVGGQPQDAEEPGEEMNLEGSEIEELPDGSAVVTLKTEGPQVQRRFLSEPCGRR